METNLRLQIQKQIWNLLTQISIRQLLRCLMQMKVEEPLRFSLLFGVFNICSFL